MLHSSPPPLSNRTLLDIIRDEEPNGKGDVNQSQKDRRSWKLFRDRLRLKRAGAAWISSVRVPASDVPIDSGSLHNPRLQLCRRPSVRYQNNPSANNSSEPTPQITRSDESVPTNNRPHFARRASTRIVPPPTEPTHQEDAADSPMSAEPYPARSFKHQISRHNSTRVPSWTPESEDNSVDPFELSRQGTRRLAVALAEERSLSAREAVAAQEAAEAEAAAAAVEQEASEVETEEQESVSREAPPASPQSPSESQPARMSLMDLLEETDRQMGLEGSRYTIADDDEGECDEEEESSTGGGEEEVGGIEHSCCVCMVRHKGSAFIPCGHTFCRLCSRELRVQRGNCPVCNGFILEILDIF